MAQSRNSWLADYQYLANFKKWIGKHYNAVVDIKQLEEKYLASLPSAAYVSKPSPSPTSPFTSDRNPSPATPPDVPLDPNRDNSFRTNEESIEKFLKFNKKVIEKNGLQDTAVRHILRSYESFLEYLDADGNI